jgi:hypothetical protein
MPSSFSCAGVSATLCEDCKKERARIRGSGKRSKKEREHREARKKERKKESSEEREQTKYKKSKILKQAFQCLGSSKKLEMAE